MQKITIVTRCMQSGGAERVIWRLIQYFVEQNYKVHLILMEDGYPVFYKIPEECTVTIIESNKKNNLAKKFDSYRTLRGTIKKTKPDVVLSMPEDIGIYVVLALLGTKTPVVVSERNNPWVMPYKKSSRILRSLMYPCAAGLVFQTNQAASFFSKNLQKKGIVLPNPLDVENLPAPYTGEREKIIVGAGRLDTQKNFPLLIDAFADFYKTHEDYKLVIYGEGGLRTTLEQYASSKRLPEGTISFPGRSKQLIEELKTKAMFVLSSDFEGMPNVVIESMAVGTPVVSTDCPSGGSAELIENGKSGILVPVKDKDALCAAMCDIADNEEYANTLSKNSIGVKERLDSRVVAEQWRKYLEDVSK